MDFAAVILAAGEGKRAGGYKPLWRIGPDTVVDRVIRAASAVCPVVRVVGGARFDRLERHIRGRHPRVELIRNQGFERGMFSSIQKGIEGLTCPVFIHPADIPGPDAGVYRALAEALDNRDPPEPLEPAVVRPAFQGRTGHPVLLDPLAARLAQQAPADSRLLDVLAPLCKIDVPVSSDLMLKDFDTAEQFAHLKTRLLSGG